MTAWWLGVAVVAVRAIAYADPAPPPVQAANTITCTSGGAREECPADTSNGVALIRTTGTAACLLGRTWGYDATGIWVTEGCAAEFTTGGEPAAAAAQTAPAKPLPTWAAYEAGKGFLLARTKIGELSISMYSLVRFLDQLPAHQTFTDHLGRQQPVDPRIDIWSHRLMVFLKGWAGTPKLVYQTILWTVNTTDQKALFGVLGYQFHRAFSLYAGLNALPGTRSLVGSHPYWLGNDRVMADEFFRPFFTNGVWATGEPYPGLWYVLMIGNNLSSLGITAAQLTRDFAYSGTVWWMPTTKEFGPNGGFDDFDHHDHVATRFGASYTQSREDRFNEDTSDIPDNTTLRLADSLNVFDLGALANNVTVQKVDYKLLAVDAGLKYKGFFLQTQYFQRWLDDFQADGPLPVSSIVDKGFYIQAACYPIKQLLELYASTSWVFGDKSAGFKTSYEGIGGANWFFTRSRDIRINAQFIWVDRSPVSSTFGYYTGGEKGPIISVAASIFF